MRQFLLSLIGLQTGMRRSRRVQLCIAQSRGNQQRLVKAKNFAKQFAEVDAVDHRRSTDVPDAGQSALRELNEHLGDIDRQTGRHELVLEESDLLSLCK